MTTTPSDRTEKIVRLIEAIPAGGEMVVGDMISRDDIEIAAATILASVPDQGEAVAWRDGAEKVLSLQAREAARGVVRGWITGIQDKPMSDAISKLADALTALDGATTIHGDGNCGCTERCKDRDNCQYDAAPLVQTPQVSRTPKQIHADLALRFNNHLCEMKENHDDSITGFNEAWDVMRTYFDEELPKFSPPAQVSGDYVPGDGLPYGIIDPDYAAFFTVARLVAWSYGYGVGLHGSFTRDLDLILVPWTDRANPDPDHVLKNIESRSGWQRLKDEGSKHPHGRLVWTLTSRRFECPRFIDIGFMPISTPPQGDSICPTCNCDIQTGDGSLECGHPKCCQHAQGDSGTKSGEG